MLRSSGLTDQDQESAELAQPLRWSAGLATTAVPVEPIRWIALVGMAVEFIGVMPNSR